ncbi:MAG: hypothetical protein JNK38_04250 [Acidobacteria bacterium]|nr:hypothetical protein [Acidobacteriota bacterium]
MKKQFGDYLARQQGRILTFILGMVVVIFIGILATAYIIAKRANPIILDETGKPVNSQTINHH